MLKGAWPVLLILVISCVDPLSIKLGSSNRRLVVDGLVTNQVGPYRVRLFSSNSIENTNEAQLEPIRGAQVFITDDLNRSFSLFEINPGIYETDPKQFQGQIGRSYYLTFITSSGQTYRSDKEEIKPPGQIEDIKLEFQESAIPNVDHSLRIYIDSQGPSGETNFLRWRWNTIFKAQANPELHVDEFPGFEVPTPRPCSGYVYRSFQLIQVGDCTCCICWSYNFSNQSLVSPNEFVSQNKFNQQFLGTIPVTSYHFLERYQINIDQLSLSESAYQFWKLIHKQQQGKNNLFQPNTIKVRGNVKNIDDSDEEVLGFFGASGVMTKSMDIKRSDIPIQLKPMEIIKFSCLEYFYNATSHKPPFW